jgi:hypothetical protein
LISGKILENHVIGCELCQFTEYDKSFRNMLRSFNGVQPSSNQNVEYYSDLIFESQQADLQQEEMISSRTENENVKFMAPSCHC